MRPGWSPAACESVVVFIAAPRLPESAVLSAAGLGAGVLVTLSLPPFGWWPLAMVGAAVLVGALRARPWPRRLLVGMAAGLGWLGPGLWWIVDFSVPGYVAAT